MTEDPGSQYRTATRDVSASDGGRGTTPEPADPAERDRAVAVFLRQLSSGLSAYRLFPGDLGQPTFVQAAERIRQAAEGALQWGPLEAEILGARFVTVHGAVPSDDRIERLALAFYQHRAERLMLRSSPGPQDLATLYAALSRPLAQTVAGGGIGASLRVAGIRSIAISEVAPQAPEKDELGGRPSTEQRQLWERLIDADAFARDLLAGERSGAPPEEIARSIYQRLQHVVSLLPDPQIQGFELHRRLHEIIARFPSSIRRALGSVLLDRVLEDPLAGRLIGTMTDAELARLLVDQSVGSHANPVELARRLVGGGVRQEDVVDLTLALLAGQEEAGTIIVGLDRVGIDVGRPSWEEAAPPGAPVVKTVSSLLARGLVSMGQDDVRAIREQWPQTQAEQRAVAAAALHDYVRIETDTDRLGEVLQVWVKEATAALRERDRERIASLMHAMEGARDDHASSDKRALVEVWTRRILDPLLLRTLVSTAEEGSAVESNVELLGSFGETAVDCLLDDLAQEQDRGRRALLLNTLCQLAKGHHNLVAKRLSDPRWYVARNAVTILHRIGRPEVVPVLMEACRHAEPAVRREAVRGIIDVGGPQAMPELVHMTQDPDPTVRAALVSGLGSLVNPGACAALAKLAVSFRDVADRRRTIDALTRHPAPEAAAELAALVSGRTKPALPRKLRRYAKAALHEREGAST